MKILFAEAASSGMDIRLDAYEQLGEFAVYQNLTPEELARKVVDADILMVNKLPVNETTIGAAKNLRLVCVIATGTNNLDKEYLASRGIEWRNVAGYSTPSVAQHTFALYFYLAEKLAFYDRFVKDGSYTRSELFTSLDRPYRDLCGQTWGIIGMGAIGSTVAGIAKSFGCQVIYYSTSGRNHRDDYTEVGLNELLTRADIVSIHAPLTEKTHGLIGREALQKMKSTAILINVGRGPIVDEHALANALENGQIAAAGLDVLETEPMRADSPLARIADSEKLLITPHIAWASVDARIRLMDIVYGQIEDFIEKEKSGNSASKDV